MTFRLKFTAVAMQKALMTVLLALFISACTPDHNGPVSVVSDEPCTVDCTDPDPTDPDPTDPDPTDPDPTDPDPTDPEEPGCAPNCITPPETVYKVGAAKREIRPIDADFNGEEASTDTSPFDNVPGYQGDGRQYFNLGGFGTRRLQGCTPEQIPLPEQQCGELLGHPGPATGNFQDTFVRVFALQYEEGDILLFVTLDAVGAGNVILDNIRSAIVDQTGVATENVVVGMTHSHSAADLQGLWGGVPKRWRNELYGKATEAAKEAVDAMEPAKLEVATRQIDYNNYRRDGGDDANTPDAVYVTDKMVTAIKATAYSSAKVVGTLVQYSAHTTVLNSSNRLVHTDYVLSLEERLERELGGVSVFYNGVIADAAPRTNSPDGLDRYGRAFHMGEGLAGEVLDMLTTASELEPTDLLIRHTEVTLPVVNPVFLAAAGANWFADYYRFGEAESGADSASVTTLVSRVQIGADDKTHVNIATVPGEATGPFGKMIREFAGGEYVMLLGLTQNSLGYILPEDEYGRMGNNYEETVSMGPHMAPMLENLGYRVLFTDIPAP